MIWGLKIGFVFFFSFWFTLPSGLLFYVDNPIVKEHNVLIKHPGEEKPIEVTLVEISNKEGLPVEYYMDVQSVICLEGVCKVIPVRLYWDNIGNFKKYRLEEGKTLEKYKADLFDSSDYSKLHTILANPDSPFKDVRLNEVLTVVNELDTHEVDAISGATALELDEKDTVPGAALTCYTLWHWANGEVVSIIQNQTGYSASIKQLESFILDADNTYFTIAVKELQRRKLYPRTIIDAILKKIKDNEMLIRPALKYFEKAIPEMYFYAIERLIYDGGSTHKLAAIQSLKDTDFTINKSDLDQLSLEIIKMDNFQEITALLGLMELKNPNSKMVIDNVFLLLESNFIIARRAYWFLNYEKITVEQQQILDDFFEKNKHRL